MASNYSKRMARLSARIFGEVARPTTPQSMKVIQLFSEKPIQQRNEYVKYYPPHVQIGNLMKILREHGLFRDEHEDFKEEILRLRLLRGKTVWKPPKREPKVKE